MTPHETRMNSMLADDPMGTRQHTTSLSLTLKTNPRSSIQYYYEIPHSQEHNRRNLAYQGYIPNSVVI